MVTVNEIDVTQFGVTVDSTTDIITVNIGIGTANGGAYTSQSFDIDFAAQDTDDLAEGATNLYYTAEKVDDQVAGLVVGGDNTTVTYNDGAGTLTIDVAVPTQLTTQDEGIQVGTNVDTLDFTGTGVLATDTAGVTTVTVPGNTSSDTAPLNPVEGDTWFNTTTGKYYHYYTDNTSSQWVEVGGVVAPILASTDALAEGATNLYYTGERVDDQVAGLITAGTNITVTYDDGLGTLTIAGVAAAPVDSVNAQTGVVVLDADDISDAATVNKYTTAADISKLAAIEASATADQTGAEIKAAYEVELNAFTDAQFTKLAGIEALATADQTDAEIKTAYENNANTNAFTDAEQTKLTGIATGAEVNTVDSVNTQTGVVTLDADDISDTVTTNKFTTAAEISKLAGIEAAATQDQSAVEIKAAYEFNSNTNAFTDAEQTKLTGIEAGADVTDVTNVDAAGAVMNTDTTTAIMQFVIDEDTMATNTATKVPTQQSVKNYVDNAVVGNLTYRGSYNAGANIPDLDTAPSGIVTGDMYTVTVAGTFFSTLVEPGDALIAEINNPVSEASWTIVQANLTPATIKTNYESNANTNAFTDAEQTKLTGIETGATVYTTTDFNADLATKTTDDLTEGTNLYYTTARANTDFDTRLGIKSTTDLTEGTNLYYTAARADTQSQLNITAMLEEVKVLNTISKITNNDATWAANNGTDINSWTQLQSEVWITATGRYVANDLAPSIESEAYRDIDVSSITNLIDNGIISVSLSAVINNLNLTGVGSCTIITYFLNGVGTQIGGQSVSSNTAGLVSVGINEVLPVGTETVRIQILARNGIEAGPYSYEITDFDIILNSTTQAFATTDDLLEGPNNFYYTGERVDDRVNSLLTAGTGITLTYNDIGGTLTIDGASNLTTLDEGLASGTDIDTLDFVGNGVSATTVGNTTTVTVSGAGLASTDDLTEGATNLYANAGDKGDITVTNSTTWSIDANAVTNAKLATAPELTVKGRSGPGAGAITDITVAALTATLTPFTTTLPGVVPAPGFGGDVSTNSLRGDGTWLPVLDDLTGSTTTDLAEGTNLYYTQGRFDTAFTAKSTTDLSEGTNLYYTDARARAALSATGDLTYNSGTGAFGVTTYKTADFTTDFAAETTTNLTEGTNLYYTQGRFDTALTAKSTTDLSEGTNLYYTDTRVDARVTASFVNALDLTIDGGTF